MNHSVYVYILVMAGVTYLIRMLPLVLFKKEITSPFVKSFLFYVPYACLAAMTFPAILTAPSSGMGSRPWRCSDRSIPGKKSSYGSSLRLRGSVCGRADSWISGII